MGILTSTYPVPEGFNPALLHDVLARQKRGGKPKLLTVDKYPVYPDDPLFESHRLIDDYLREAGPDAYTVKPASLAAGRTVLETPIEQWPKHLLAALVRVLFYWTWSVERSDEMFGNIVMWRYGSN